MGVRNVEVNGFINHEKDNHYVKIVGENKMKLLEIIIEYKMMPKKIWKMEIKKTL